MNTGPHARRLLRDPLALTAFLTLLAVFLVALVGPYVIEASPRRVELGDRLIAPMWSGGDWTHPLGTDALGRDMLARLVGSARVSLFIGTVVVAVSATFGTLVGLVAGYRGGLTDTVLMRLADAQLAFPGLVLVLAVVGALGPSVQAVIVVLSALGWMIFARLSRGIASQLKTGGYVRAAELMGCSRPRLFLRHLLPAVRGPLLTQAVLELGRVMLTEASLSYLGFGIQPPAASWGLMVAENRPYLRTAWWAVTLPGLALAVCVLVTNILAGWVKIQLDPYQRQTIESRRLRRRSRDRPTDVGAPVP